MLVKSVAPVLVLHVHSDLFRKKMSALIFRVMVFNYPFPSEVLSSVSLLLLNHCNSNDGIDFGVTFEIWNVYSSGLVVLFFF